MTAVLIDFATRRVVVPPPSQLPRDERLEERWAWTRRRNAMLVAKYELRALDYRTFTRGSDEPGMDGIVDLWKRARAAYSEARVVLMAWPACDKAGVRWKWRQMSELADRRSEWEPVLAADEIRFGMGQDRPKIETPARPTAPIDEAGLTSAQRAVIAAHFAAVLRELKGTPPH